MYIRILIGIVVAYISILPLCAEQQDSITVRTIDEVVVSTDIQQKKINTTPFNISVTDNTELTRLFNGNLMQTLDAIAGVQSMGIGSGFSKPMIRGMGFNRVAVTEYGIKQEGQQWGSDHGLEIDAFNVDQVVVRKGASSLLYGSDAIGGVIEIVIPQPPIDNQIFGDVSILAKSVNDLLGGSLMLGFKHNNWSARVRYSEQQFADYKVPTDTIVYLTQRMPLIDGRLNNTAGYERNASVLAQYNSGRYTGRLSASNVYQKTGFFAGAHGIPNANNIIDDGDYRDIDLPYSFVNHFKVALHQRYLWEKLWLEWNLGYQNNHREEWSSFHTHYPTQTAPEVDPDKELLFKLDTYSSTVNIKLPHSANFDSEIICEMQYQNNQIGGYSFLLPEYNRATMGAGWVGTYNVNSNFTLSGGLRYDVGRIEISGNEDENIESYLLSMGYSAEIAAENAVRSEEVTRKFGNYSASAGFVWQLPYNQLLKANLGRSFRLPSANELAANGVHHGSFRHERGDNTLESEKGWQMDVAYQFENKYISLEVSPYVSWFSNYIYLQPTGEWSLLPDAGQIYQYVGAMALIAGAEISATIYLPYNFAVDLNYEYFYGQNLETNIPLSFSPPAQLTTTLRWQNKWVEPYIQCHIIADQNRIAQGEDPTEGAEIFNLGASVPLEFITTGATANLSVENLFNTKYYNHISYYRQMEIPEAGRNFQLSIKIPFRGLFRNQH